MSVKLFRAVLIDPELRIVTDIETTGTPTAMRELIHAGGLDHFRIADHDSSWDYGWVDEHGLSRGAPAHAFKFSVRKDPIAGRCILIGVDKNTGDTIDAKFNREILRAEIEWLGLIRPEVTWDHAEDGSTAIVTYARVQ